MPRPFNLRQARENAAFIRQLGETGNVQLAARECGLAKATLYSRRRVHAPFAAEWDAAMIAAQARMRAGGGRAPAHAGAARGARFKTRGGEPKVTRMADGGLQMRLARAGGFGFRAEQAFLRALATCGNIAMAARAIGVAPANIYAKRGRCPVFKAEMDVAREIACDRLELALLERMDAALCGTGADSIWMDGELGPLPPTSFENALMQLNLYRRWMALGENWAGRLAFRKRRGHRSSDEWLIERDIWFWQQKEKRAAQERREARGTARGRVYEETGNWFLPGEVVEDVLEGSGGEKGPSRG